MHYLIHYKGIKIIIGWILVLAVLQGCVSDKTFMEAISKRDVALVKELIDKGADVNGSQSAYTHSSFLATPDRCSMPLTCAAGRPTSLEIVKLLVENGAVVDGDFAHGGLALQLAMFNNHAPTVRYLLEHGAKTNFVRRAERETLLLLACRKSDIDVEIIKLLIKYGADVNWEDRDGITPAFTAAQTGRPDILHVLLTNGANPTKKDETGCSLLWPAARSHNREQTTRYLLGVGFDVNAKNYHGSTVLYSALGLKNNDLLELLLEHDADVNVANKKGMTPLMVVKDVKSAQRLLDAGAHLHTKSKEGKTVLDYVISRKKYQSVDYSELIAFLKDAQKKYKK